MVKGICPWCQWCSLLGCTLKGWGGNISHQLCVDFAKNGQVLETNAKHVKETTHELWLWCKYILSCDPRTRVIFGVVAWVPPPRLFCCCFGACITFYNNEELINFFNHHISNAHVAIVLVNTSLGFAHLSQRIVHLSQNCFIPSQIHTCLGLKVCLVWFGRIKCQILRLA